MKKIILCLMLVFVVFTFMGCEKKPKTLKEGTEQMKKDFKKAKDSIVGFNGYRIAC